MSRMFYPKFIATDSSGDPLVGGKLYTYSTGTTTPKTTYSDAAMGVANANPVILDSRGEALVYGSGEFRFVLKDSDDVTVWTVDNILAGDVVGASSGKFWLVAASGACAVQANSSSNEVLEVVISEATNPPGASQYAPLRAETLESRGDGSAVDGTIKLYAINGKIATLTPSGLSAHRTQYIADVALAVLLGISLGSAPSGAGDTGMKGDVRADANYIYVCTADDTWKRIAWTAW